MFPQLGVPLHNGASPLGAEGGFVVGRFGGLHQCLSFLQGAVEKTLVARAGRHPVEVALPNSAPPWGAEGGFVLGRFGAECAEILTTASRSST